MRNSIKQLVDELDRAKQALEDEILAEMVLEAHKQGLDNFTLTYYCNVYERNGAEVECHEIEALDSIYLDHIHTRGVEAHWKRGLGYV